MDRCHAASRVGVTRDQEIDAYQGIGIGARLVSCAYAGNPTPVRTRVASSAKTCKPESNALEFCG
jgi:hypothetical protein